MHVPDAGGQPELAECQIAPADDTVVARALLPNVDGTLWVATDKGLGLLAGGTLTIYGRDQGLAAASVRVLYRDRSGTIWAGTNAGLARLDGGRFVMLTTRDGLSNDYVRAIFADDDGSLWVGTEDGPFVQGHAQPTDDAALIDAMGAAYAKKYWIAWAGFFKPRSDRVAATVNGDVTLAATFTSSVAAGSFANPVLWEDLADLDLFRVGDVYYYSASTMHYSPGAPVLRSWDLVHWEYIGHSVPVLDWSAKYDLTGGSAYVKGIWASTMRYRASNQKFYWLGCVEFSRSYVYTASAAEVMAAAQKYFSPERRSVVVLKGAQQ